VRSAFHLCSKASVKGTGASHRRGVEESLRNSARSGLGESVWCVSTVYFQRLHDYKTRSFL
jgi:hypothetical protein